VGTYTVDILTDIIKKLSDDIVGVEAVVLETYEGLVLASTLPTNKKEEIIAAISSVAQSVTNRAVKELDHGVNQNTFLINERGQVILTNIDGKALLTVIAERGANTGLISIMSRRIAQDIRQYLPF